MRPAQKARAWMAWSCSNPDRGDHATSNASHCSTASPVLASPRHCSRMRTLRERLRVTSERFVWPNALLTSVTAQWGWVKGAPVESRGWSSMRAKALSRTNAGSGKGCVENFEHRLESSVYLAARIGPSLLREAPIHPPMRRLFCAITVLIAAFRSRHHLRGCGFGDARLQRQEPGVFRPVRDRAASSEQGQPNLPRKGTPVAP